MQNVKCKTELFIMKTSTIYNTYSRRLDVPFILSCCRNHDVRKVFLPPKFNSASLPSRYAFVSGVTGLGEFEDLGNIKRILHVRMYAFEDISMSRYER